MLYVGRSKAKLFETKFACFFLNIFKYLFSFISSKMLDLLEDREEVNEKGIWQVLQILSDVLEQMINPLLLPRLRVKVYQQ